MGFSFAHRRGKEGVYFFWLYVHRRAFGCCPRRNPKHGLVSCHVHCFVSSAPKGRVTELTGAKLYQHSTAAKHSLLALRKPAAREPKRTTRGPRVCSRRLSCQVTSGQPGMTGGGTRKKKGKKQQEPKELRQRLKGRIICQKWTKNKMWEKQKKGIGVGFVFIASI